MTLALREKKIQLLSLHEETKSLRGEAKFPNHTGNLNAGLINSKDHALYHRVLVPLK